VIIVSVCSRRLYTNWTSSIVMSRPAGDSEARLVSNHMHARLDPSILFRTSLACPPLSKAAASYHARYRSSILLPPARQALPVLSDIVQY